MTTSPCRVVVLVIMLALVASCRKEGSVSTLDLDVAIEHLAAREPVAHDLGTPVLDLGDPEFERIVAQGASAVPNLARKLQGSSAREAAWIVAALGDIGGPEAASALKEACARWQTYAPADEWVHAVRGQCNIAQAKLKSRP